MAVKARETRAAVGRVRGAGLMGTVAGVMDEEAGVRAMAAGVMGKEAGMRAMAAVVTGASGVGERAQMGREAAVREGAEETVRAVGEEAVGWVKATALQG